MALLTLAEFKASGTYLLNTAIFGTDAITSQLILDAEESYLSVRDRPFKKITGTYESGSAEITNIPYYDIMSLKRGMRASGDYIRGKITDVDIDNSKITLDSVSTDAGTADELDIYPEQSLDVAIKIVAHLRRTATLDTSKKSESIEKHSWSNWGPTESRSGLPMSIASRIKSYANAKEGQKTGQGYWKGQEEVSTKDIDPVVRNDADVTVTE